jgi:hypothetical protein
MLTVRLFLPDTLNTPVKVWTIHDDDDSTSTSTSSTHISTHISTHVNTSSTHIRLDGGGNGKRGEAGSSSSAAGGPTRAGGLGQLAAFGVLPPSGSLPSAPTLAETGTVTGTVTEPVTGTVTPTPPVSATLPRATLSPIPEETESSASTGTEEELPETLTTSTTVPFGVSKYIPPFAVKKPTMPVQREAANLSASYLDPKLAEAVPDIGGVRQSLWHLKDPKDSQDGCKILEFGVKPSGDISNRGIDCRTRSFVEITPEQTAEVIKKSMAYNIQAYMKALKVLYDKSASASSPRLAGGDGAPARGRPNKRYARIRWTLTDSDFTVDDTMTSDSKSEDFNGNTKLKKIYEMSMNLPKRALFHEVISKTFNIRQSYEFFTYHGIIEYVNSLTSGKSSDEARQAAFEVSEEDRAQTKTKKTRSGSFMEYRDTLRKLKKESRDFPFTRSQTTKYERRYSNLQ